MRSSRCLALPARDSYTTFSAHVGLTLHYVTELAPGADVKLLLFDPAHTRENGLMNPKEDPEIGHLTNTIRVRALFTN